MKELDLLVDATERLVHAASSRLGRAHGHMVIIVHHVSSAVWNEEGHAG